MDESAALAGGGITQAPLELPAADWKRLNELLAEVLEVDAEQRAAWVAALRDEDRHLAPVLTQLLARAFATGAATSTMPRRRGPLLSTSSSEPRCAEVVPGQVVGPYRLLRALADGGMGSVWLAERNDGMFQREVAVKLPRAEWTDRGLAARMARERSVLAALNHPNIAQLYDAGWAGDGRPYLALEYVEGETIDAYCRERGLGPTACVRLFVDVVRAVAFAHAKLVIHRDLKPSNVLVTTDGVVKLLDFGIAKILSDDATTAEETALTRLSGRAMTLNYAAPEQIRGEAVSTATDTYSLGVMLFELLTGSRPYRTESDSRGALEQAVTGTDPPLPSRIAADANVRRALKGDVDAIVLKALRKRPEERYETASAFADDLERWLDHRPVRAQRRGDLYRLQRFAARHRTRLAAGGAVAGLVVLGASILLWQRHVAGEEAARAETVKSLVLSIIAQADPSASPETRDADLTLLTMTEARLASELGKHPALALELRIALARAYRHRGEFQRAAETLRKAIAEAKQSLPVSDHRLATAVIEAAEWRVTWSRDLDPELDRAIEIMRARGREGADRTIEGLQLRAYRHAFKGDDAMAEADLREALALAVRYYGKDHPKSLLAQVRLADTYEIEPLPPEHLERLEVAFRTALGVPSLARSDPAFLEIQSAYGKALCESGRGAEGLALLRQSAETARKHHGGGFATERALLALANALYVTGDGEGALKVSQEVFAVATAREPGGTFARTTAANGVLGAMVGSRRVSGIEAGPEEAFAPEHNRWGMALMVWLKAYRGDLVGAIDLAPRALQAATERRWSWWAKSARLAWSYALRQSDRPQEAAEILAPLASVAHPLTYWWDNQCVVKERAAVRLALGDDAAALKDADLAIRHLAVPRLRTDPALADLQLTRGRALLGLGRPDEAVEALRSADAFWRDYDPTSHWAAEAAYWHARALIASGRAIDGRPLLKSAQQRLARSPMPLHKRLASTDDALR